MIVHPKIKELISKIKKSDDSTIEEIDLKVLWEANATATEAVIALHLGFDFSVVNAEKFVQNSQIWEPENIQDIAYQTFLYMNYNPDDPNFSYDEDSVKFSLIPPCNKSEGTD